MRRRLASGEVVDERDLVELSRVPKAPPLPAARPVEALRQAKPSSGAPRDDKGLLEALLASGRLYEGERRGFMGMLRGLDAFGCLTWAQRSWAQTTARRIGMPVDAPEGWQETARAIRGR